MIEYNDSYVSGLAEPKLKGQVALVTGAGRGLGRTYAHRLSALGARVAVLDLNLKSYADFAAEREAMEGDSTVSEIEARGGEAMGLEVDVTDSAAVNRAIEQIVQRVEGTVGLLQADRHHRAGRRGQASGGQRLPAGEEVTA